jgi:hypothetical protein
MVAAIDSIAIVESCHPQPERGARNFLGALICLRGIFYFVKDAGRKSVANRVGLFSLGVITARGIVARTDVYG